MRKIKYPMWLNGILLIALIIVTIFQVIARFKQVNVERQLWSELKQRNKIQKEFNRTYNDLAYNVDVWTKRVERANVKSKQVNEFLEHIKKCPSK
jgi:cell division protein FtsL